VGNGARGNKRREREKKTQLRDSSLLSGNLRVSLVAALVFVPEENMMPGLSL
jgi:hypothetical protein